MWLNLFLSTFSSFSLLFETKMKGYIMNNDTGFLRTVEYYCLSILQDSVTMKLFIFTCLLAVALAKHVSDALFMKICYPNIKQQTHYKRGFQPRATRDRDEGRNPLNLESKKTLALFTGHMQADALFIENFPGKVRGWFSYRLQGICFLWHLFEFTRGLVSRP